MILRNELADVELIYLSETFSVKTLLFFLFWKSTFWFWSPCCYFDVCWLYGLYSKLYIIYCFEGVLII